MKKALTVNSLVGTIVVPSGGKVNIMNIDPVTEKMTWECYDSGIMMYIGVLALSKADDSAIDCFFCIPRCQVVFVEIDRMQVVLCCSQVILLEHDMDLFTPKFGWKMKVGSIMENEFQQEIF